MTKVIDKFIKDLKIRQRANSTLKQYLLALKGLSRYHPTKDLTMLTHEEVQDFLFHLVKQKKSWSWINIHISAFRFFYGITLERNLRQFVIPRPKPKKKLPQVMSRGEVARALDTVAGNPRQAAFFKLLYGCGLRGIEACSLQRCDIDSGNQRIWVRDAKGSKDRGVYLPKTVYRAMADYWRAFRFKEWVFPAYLDANRPMNPERARYWFREVKELARIRKGGMLHMWRHSYATHMLEDGQSLLEIKKALGHASLKSTMIYLHLVAGREGERKSPIDKL